MATQSPPKTNLFDKISEIRKWVVLLLIALVLFFGYKYFTSNSSNSTIEYDTNLIQQQIKNVGKLSTSRKNSNPLNSSDFQFNRTLSTPTFRPSEFFLR